MDLQLTFYALYTYELFVLETGCKSRNISHISKLIVLKIMYI
jgi:hypothetical protein